MVPSMLRKGYSENDSGGVTASGGTLGILIPPSVPMFIYGVSSETTIPRLFAAGILPGCAHNAHLEQPDLFNQVVSGFFQSPSLRP